MCLMKRIMKRSFRGFSSWSDLNVFTNSAMNIKCYIMVQCAKIFGWFCIIKIDKKF